METLRKDLQDLMLLSGSKAFDAKLLQLKNTYTTAEKRSFIYNFLLADMNETHKAIKVATERVEQMKIAETV